MSADQQTLERPVVLQEDADRFAHYAKKADVARAYVEGTAIVALCGLEWTPSRDPERYPLCPACDYLMENVVGTGPLAGGGQ